VTDSKNQRLTLADCGDVLSAREVQRVLGIGRNSTYDLINSGRLRSVRLAKTILVPRSALAAFLGVDGETSGALTPGKDEPNP